MIPLAAYWDAPIASPLPVRVLVRPHLEVPMFAAGLHASILTPAGPLISCAVVARPAPPDLAGPVARIPAVLRGDEVMPWLSGSSRDARRTAWESRAWEALTVAGSRLVSSGTAGFAAP
ncbi:SOS response-associated peptidase family protein [Deinococcus sp. PEB2-63]